MGLFFVFSASLLWALDTLIRYPLIYGGLSATKLVFAEHLILVLALFPFLWRHQKRLLNIGKRDLISFILIGGLGSALATLSFTKAFGLLNPSLVILLQKFQPLIAILLANKVLGEPLKREFIGWAILCLIGGLLISYEDVIKGWNQFFNGGQALLGYFLTFVAVGGWGASTVFGKRLSDQGYSEVELMGGRFFFGLLFLIPAVLSEEAPLITELSTWSKISFMVLISGFMGMGLYYLGLKRLSARLCALAEMFFPFCAIAVNWIFLEATLAPLQLLGGFLLLVGSTVLQLKRY
ncbi:MAG: DMT family transporter [Bdellovibrionota bacterium]|jgi:drug/metabolite transporter (DMT)-like permease|nr:DMT family transporter [Bdellovibrionota bacterium]